MGEGQPRIFTRFNSWSIIFFLFFYLNDLPKITTKNTKFILNSNDTSTIQTNPIPKDFKINFSKVFVDMNKWFETSVLSFNLK